MIHINKSIRIFFLLGIFLLIEVDVGATGNMKYGKEVTLEVNDSTQLSDAEVSNEHIFYVDEWIKSWFTRLDKNQDNKISRNEFVTNMELLDVNEFHFSLFKSNNTNPDGALSLKEFKSFVDTTNIFTQEEMTEIAAANSVTEGDSLDVVKLLAGVVAISLLMAAFRLM